MYRFRQVDVFSSAPLLGNPVAVVHDADDLTDEQMAAFARWTNLSETTFLLRPTDPAADYRLRIFTPGGELPFAGHPTLGSAHAWLEDGGVPASAGTVVQECGAGLVRLRRGAALAFAAPPLVRSGPADAAVVDRIAAGLRVPAAEILAAEWVDNGPGWVAARLRDADAVLALRPDFAAMGELNVGVVGAYPAGGDADVEIRAFCPSLAVPEDPVTGSLNAGIAQWLIGTGELPDRYTASQGTALGRRGRVHVERDGDAIWIGGATSTTICGEVSVS
ncbi:Trans-2,3-dihydro-3-hydroxyanthranilate isomerase (plasmid) [Tsukamurella tyrosinosolvens]|uniref:Phenazine biosynthesis protein PhzF family n=1 Tax=Tsukamurella tyrosinosolvens TaxID=57704 RepID=A0A1H4N4F3_TSUTY|nr:PhzF family phenazine biosynthesis protein [Tsukamurella tyrosinosolvens]KXO97028.1 phenazine biosynthesis protein PhzF [Tsukamurella tyrosinosolvens]SEB89997.1 phenazine biosynthesis protein PhzF family [Tsukamurella tyrosinosolvens]VEI00447.1 Trans-2,3-dihydro-3-hydroxyanthranilate isomerase [Tsukamurella tyrosinosolvens]